MTAHDQLSATAPDPALDSILDAFRDWREVRRLLGRGDCDTSTMLIGLRSPDLRLRALAAHRGSEVTEVMAVAATDRSAVVRIVAAQSRATPPDILAGFVTDRSRRCRERAAINPSTTAETRDGLADDRTAQVRRHAAAGHPLLPSTLARLAADADPGVRGTVANRRDLPDHWTRQLAKDRVGWVRAILGCATRLVDVMLDLADESNANVAGAVAANPAATTEVLARLVRHDHVEVRSVLPGHSAMSLDLHRRLMTDTEPTVRQGVATHCTDPSVLAGLARDRALKVRYAVIGNPAATPEVFRAVYYERSPQLSRAIAQHENAPDDVVERALAILRVSSDASFRESAREIIAGRRALGRSVPAVYPISNTDPVVDLASVYDWLDTRRPIGALRRAATDPATPRPIRRVVLRREGLPVEALVEAATDRASEIRALVAANPSTPADTLIQLGGDRKVSVRMNVIANPSAPLTLLRSLRNDSERDVRIAARGAVRRREMGR